jgi:predicted XRE-type DNA-binding protein
MPSGGSVARKVKWPSEETLGRLDKKLSRVKGSRVVSADADPVERIKHALCEAVVRYCQDHGLSQRDLAKLLDVSESRVSEMVHYRVEKLTIDRLVKHLAKLKQTVKVQVA